MNFGVKNAQPGIYLKLCPQIREAVFSSEHRVQAVSLKDAIYKMHICTIHIHRITFQRTASKLHFLLPALAVLHWDTEE